MKEVVGIDAYQNLGGLVRCDALEAVIAGYRESQRDDDSRPMIKSLHQPSLYPKGPWIRFN